MHDKVFETLHKVKCKGQANFYVLCMRCSVSNQKLYLTEQLAHLDRIGIHTVIITKWDALLDIKFACTHLAKLFWEYRVMFHYLSLGTRVVFIRNCVLFQQLHKLQKMGYFWRSAVAKVSLPYRICCVNCVSLVHSYLRYIECICTANNEFLNFWNVQIF